MLNCNIIHMKALKRLHRECLRLSNAQFKPLQALTMDYNGHSRVKRVHTLFLFLFFLQTVCTHTYCHHTLEISGGNKIIFISYSPYIMWKISRA